MFQICRPSNYGQQSNAVPTRALLLFYCFVIDQVFGWSFLYVANVLNMINVTILFIILIIYLFTL